MESIDPVWLFGAIALATGILLGMLINRLLNPSAGDVEQLKAELESARAEMERYKASVNSHFTKTSELVNDLTQDYVKVYRHLAEGAQTLSDTREFSHVLEQQKGRVLLSVEDRPSPAPAVGAGDMTGEAPRANPVEDDIVEDGPPVTAAEATAPAEVDDESRVPAAQDVKDTAESGAVGDDRKQAVSEAGVASAETTDERNTTAETQTTAKTGAETATASDDATEAKARDDEQPRQAEAAQQQPAAAAEGEAEAESSRKA